MSVNSVLSFSLYKPCISLVQFVPKYFIPFDGMVNGIVLLISHLQVFGNTIDFCILIFFPPTLLNLLISCNGFF